jgi:hypothetical protein
LQVSQTSLARFENFSLIMKQPGIVNGLSVGKPHKAGAETFHFRGRFIVFRRLITCPGRVSAGRALLVEYKTVLVPHHLPLTSFSITVCSRLHNRCRRCCLGRAARLIFVSPAPLTLPSHLDDCNVDYATPPLLSFGAVADVWPSSPPRQSTWSYFPCVAPPTSLSVLLADTNRPSFRPRTLHRLGVRVSLAQHRGDAPPCFQSSVARVLESMRRGRWRLARGLAIGVLSRSKYKGEARFTHGGAGSNFGASPRTFSTDVAVPK